MISPQQAQDIADLGVAALLVFFIAFSAVAIWRKWIVVGWIYDQERTGRLTAETQALRNAEALEATNTSMLALLKEVGAMRREIRGVREDLKRALSANRGPDA